MVRAVVLSRAHRSALHGRQAPGSRRDLLRDRDRLSVAGTATAVPELGYRSPTSSAVVTRRHLGTDRGSAPGPGSANTKAATPNGRRSPSMLVASPVPRRSHRPPEVMTPARRSLGVNSGRSLRDHPVDPPVVSAASAVCGRRLVEGRATSGARATHRRCE